MFLIFFVLGITIASLESNKENTEMLNRMRLNAVAVAGGIDPFDHLKLEYSPKDLTKKEYKSLRELLITYGNHITDIRGIYTLKIKDQSLYFGPENYSETDPMASPIGTRYEKPDPRIWKVFSSGQATAFGPFTDEYGTFVSAFAPVINPEDGSVISIIGVDVLADRWQQSLFSVRFWLVAVTYLIEALFLLTLITIKLRQSKKAQNSGSWRNQVEALFIFLTGIVISAVILIGTKTHEKYSLNSELAREASLIFSHARASLVRVKFKLEEIMAKSGENGILIANGIINPVEACKRSFGFSSFAWFEIVRGLNGFELTVNKSGDETILNKIGRKNLENFLKKDETEDIFLQRPVDKTNYCLLPVMKVRKSDQDNVFFLSASSIDVQGLFSQIMTGSGLKGNFYEISCFALTGSDSYLLASLPEQIKIKNFATTSFSQANSIYFPLFMINKVLLTRFSHGKDSLSFWNLWGNAILLSTFSLGLFLILAMMVGMYRRRQELLETEVSERTRELLLAEGKFKNLVESISDWVWEIDAEGVYRYIYCGKPELMSVKPEQIIGKKFYELLPEDEKARNLEFFQELVKNPRAFYDFENKYDTENGPVWYANSGVPFFHEDGTLAGFRGTARNITDKKKVLRELSLSRDQYSLAVKGSRDGVWDWNIITNEVYFSPRWKEMIGYADDELENKISVFEELLHPDEKSVVMKYINEYLKGNIQEYSIEYRMRHKNGHYVWILDRAAALRDENGLPLRMAGSHSDITHRKESEEEIERTLIELEQVIDELHKANEKANELKLIAEKANAAKSEFLANMSHEIRTPLNGIIGMTDLLVKTGLKNDQIKYAEIIKTSGEKLLAIINDILDFSRIEAGSINIEKSEFDLRATVEDAVDLLALKAEEKKLSYSCFIEPQIPEILIGDPNRVRQILLNLAGNAIKFTDRGAVQIEVRELSSNDDKILLKFTVKDTGIGISETSKNDIFKAFTQADTSITRKFEGTGLGLAISKKLVELMGGTLDFSSEENLGSEFYFCLEFTCKKAEKSGSMIEGEGIKLLLINDDIYERHCQKILLSHWGFEVIEDDKNLTNLKKLNNDEIIDETIKVCLIDNNIVAGNRAGFYKEFAGLTSKLKFILFSPILLQEQDKEQDNKFFFKVLHKPIRQSFLQHALKCMISASREKTDPNGKAYSESLRKYDKFRLLLAEDNSTNQIVARTMFEKLGADVVLAANGIEAIELAEKERFDIIFMDCQMPEMDGFVATQKIRSSGKSLNKVVPIIAMTANALAGVKEKCLECGMDDYISKPFKITDIENIFEKWLGKDGSTNILQANHQNPSEEIKEDLVEIPVFDFDEVMARMLNKTSLIKNLLKTFANESPKLIQEYFNLCEKGDFKNARIKIHGLKGASSNVGARRLWAYAREVEQELKAEILFNYSEKRQKLEALLQEFLNVADKKLNS
ncbi:MAG: hypothetical protein Kow0029_12030 [Candidatus Rifleibacteriota bacterium]